MILFRVDAETEVRLLEPHHAAEVYSVVDRSREHVRPWLPWAGGNRRVEEVRQFIEASLTEFAARQTMACGIFHRRAYVGGIGSHFDMRNLVASIGYWIAPDLQGCGIVTKCSRLMTDYLFTEYLMERVEIRCQVENVRSRRIPERLGFREEGTLRRVFRVAERNVDMVVYGMTRADWSASRGREIS